MLEYIKVILQKVSFDRYLFEKELRKATQVLVPNDLSELKKWCYLMFGALYLGILNKYFDPVPS